MKLTGMYRRLGCRTEACRKAHAAAQRRYRTGAGRENERLAGVRKRERQPDKVNARNALNNAVRDGRLIRQPCEVCGEWAEAHHEDYSKPLSVRWLCKPHHGEVTV